jgi:flagellar hook-associated protein 1 FlgK
MANGMGSLYIGVSGLQSSQTALNTTAHNLANINSVGYTRQQIVFSDTSYLTVNTLGTLEGKAGLGVTVQQIRRIRNEFIDRAYRTENSRLGYYNSNYSAVEEVEDLFGEMQGVTFQDCLQNLKSAVNELQKNPTSTVARSSLIQYASAFITRANTIYSELCDYQDTLNTEVVNSINRINELGDTILSLNKQIQGIESAGGEKANDLRDERDSALDELSGYIKISYYEEASGRVVVSCEGNPFVGENNVNHMSYRMVEGTTLMLPTWPSFETDVFDITKPIVNGDNDTGSLKGLIMARGSVPVTASSVPVKPDEEDYDLTTDVGLAEYNAAYADYEKAQDYYNTYIEPSAILSAFAGLDKLVNGIVEGINDILCPEKQLTLTQPLTDANGEDLQADMYYYTSSESVLYTGTGQEVQGVVSGTAADGSDIYSYEYDDQLYSFDVDGNRQKVDADTYVYSILDLDATDYGSDDDRTVGEELFSRKNTDRYIVIQDANGDDMYVRNNLDIRGNESLYTIGNLEINETVAHNVGKIPLTTLVGGEDFERAEQLLDLWSADFASLNPELYSKATYDVYYTNFIDEYATMGKVLQNYVSNQETMVDGYDNQRLEIEGVSSDEELEKMIKYQQAYNAASRYINVVDSMIEHIINSLGNA